MSTELEILKRIEKKLDVLDNRVEKHLERIVKTETDIKWISKTFKFATGLIATIISISISFLYERFIR